MEVWSSFTAWNLYLNVCLPIAVPRDYRRRYVAAVPSISESHLLDFFCSPRGDRTPFVITKKVGFNDSFYAYLYAVLLTACLLFLMEAIMLMVRL